MPSSYTLPGYIGQYANTSPGSVSGSPGGTGSGTPYGRVPTVPDPILSADQAISGNLANLGKLYQLGGSPVAHPHGARQEAMVAQAALFATDVMPYFR